MCWGTKMTEIKTNKGQKLFFLQFTLEMMKALENDKVEQNVNYTLVFHFYLFIQDFFKLLFSPSFSIFFFFKYKMNQKTVEDLGWIIMRTNMKQN